MDLSIGNLNLQFNITETEIKLYRLLRIYYHYISGCFYADASQASVLCAYCNGTVIHAYFHSLRFGEGGMYQLFHGRAVRLYYKYTRFGLSDLASARYFKYPGGYVASRPVKGALLPAVFVS